MKIIHKADNCSGAVFWPMGVVMVVGILLVIFMAGVTAPDQHHKQSVQPSRSWQAISVESAVGCDWVFMRVTNASKLKLFICYPKHLQVTSFRSTTENSFGRSDPTGVLKYWEVTVTGQENGGTFTEEFKLQTPSSIKPTFMALDRVRLDQYKQEALVYKSAQSKL